MMTVNNITASLMILFAVIIVGDTIGKVEFCGIKFDKAAILFVGVVAGLVLSLAVGEDELLYLEQLNLNMKLVSSMGTSFFVSAIGIECGYLLNNHFNLKNIKYIFCGVFMSACGFVITTLIALINKDADISLLYGVMCGVLTTTPGLSSLCEINGISSEVATVGYGIAYILGIATIMIFIQSITRKTTSKKIDSHKSKNIDNRNCEKGLLIVIAVALLGKIIGNVEISKFHISIGESCGMLIVGLIIGFILQKNKIKSCEASFNMMRNLGLMLFLAASGISAALLNLKSIDYTFIIWGFIIVLPTLIIGYIITKFVFKEEKTDVATVISGGVTSTPSMGMLMHRYSNIDTYKYSLTYIGALLTMMFLMKLVVFIV